MFYGIDTGGVPFNPDEIELSIGKEGSSSRVSGKGKVTYRVVSNYIYERVTFPIDTSSHAEVSQSEFVDLITLEVYSGSDNETMELKITVNNNPDNWVNYIMYSSELIGSSKTIPKLEFSLEAGKEEITGEITVTGTVKIIHFSMDSKLNTNSANRGFTLATAVVDVRNSENTDKIQMFRPVAISVPLGGILPWEYNVDVAVDGAIYFFPGSSYRLSMYQIEWTDVPTGGFYNYTKFNNGKIEYWQASFGSWSYDRDKDGYGLKIELRDVDQDFKYSEQSGIGGGGIL